METKGGGWSFCHVMKLTWKLSVALSIKRSLSREDGHIRLRLHFLMTQEEIPASSGKPTPMRAGQINLGTVAVLIKTVTALQDFPVNNVARVFRPGHRFNCVKVADTG